MAANIPKTKPEPQAKATGTDSSTVGIFLAKSALYDLRHIRLAIPPMSKVEYRDYGDGSFSDVTRYDLSATKARGRKYP